MTDPSLPTWADPGFDVGTQHADEIAQNNELPVHLRDDHEEK
jgi:hypothetical protein